jgi:hypothetical protein
MSSDPTKKPEFERVIRHFVTTPHKPHKPHKSIGESGSDKSKPIKTKNRRQRRPDENAN